MIPPWRSVEWTLSAVITWHWVSVMRRSPIHSTCTCQIDQWTSQYTHHKFGSYTMRRHMPSSVPGSVQLLPIQWLCITATKSFCNYLTYKTTNCWHSVDAAFNVLSSQNLLPSIIVFIMMRTDCLPFWLIETRPFGKAKSIDILALFALIRMKFIYLAKQSISPAIHLFSNWYSHATVHYSLIIHL